MTEAAELDPFGVSRKPISAPLVDDQLYSMAGECLRFRGYAQAFSRSGATKRP